MTISIKFVSKKEQQSEYDWADISYGDDRIGKARCKVEDSAIIIHSINIYPEFEGSGYGRKFVQYCKKHFNVVTADRVRPTAVGFWKAVGFHDNNDGAWIYKKRSKREK
jgi:N-acetylglutamate synthase-like GNAT family acetyltransferase